MIVDIFSLEFDEKKLIESWKNFLEIYNLLQNKKYDTIQITIADKFYEIVTFSLENHICRNFYLNFRSSNRLDIFQIKNKKIESCYLSIIPSIKKLGNFELSSDFLKTDKEVEDKMLLDEFKLIFQNYF